MRLFARLASTTRGEAREASSGRLRMGRQRFLTEIPGQFRENPRKRTNLGDPCKSLMLLGCISKDSQFFSSTAVICLELLPRIAERAPPMHLCSRGRCGEKVAQGGTPRCGVTFAVALCWVPETYSGKAWFSAQLAPIWAASFLSNN